MFIFELISDQILDEPDANSCPLINTIWQISLAKADVSRSTTEWHWRSKLYLGTLPIRDDHGVCLQLPLSGRCKAPQSSGRETVQRSSHGNKKLTCSSCEPIIPYIFTSSGTSLTRALRLTTTSMFWSWMGIENCQVLVKRCLRTFSIACEERLIHAVWQECPVLAAHTLDFLWQT